MKINNKGYASTIIMFSVLALFLISMLMLVKTMNNSSSLNKKITEKVVDNIDYDSSGSVQDRLSILENQLKNMENSMLDKIYPVGSVYISTTYSTTEEVKNAIGGEWEKYAQGRTIIGEGTSTDEKGNTVIYTKGKVGGSKTEKLSVANLPSHNHTIDHTHNVQSKTYETNTVSLTGNISMHNYVYSSPVYHAAGIFKENYVAPNYSYLPNIQNSGATSLGEIGIDASHKHTLTVGSHTTDSPSKSISGNTGGNASFSVQDPYIVTYMYKRVK